MPESGWDAPAVEVLEEDAEDWADGPDQDAGMVADAGGPQVAAQDRGPEAMDV